MIERSLKCLVLDPVQVLNTVNIIRNESMLMELKYADLEERFRTRLLYAMPEEVNQCNNELADASQVWTYHMYE